ncbi:MAGE-like protein 2 [Grus japonensis]|uniref:MAGE-like protein 2 n=1 Tax=Grus japonensis TaxID=30415 RepID=A0ABC9YEX7_GRUJA
MLWGLAMPHTDLRARLLNAIESFHPLAQRGKAVGLVCKPPDLHPRVPNPLPGALRPSARLAASKPPADGRETAPASSSKAHTNTAAKPKQLSWLCLSPMGCQTPQDRLPQQLFMLPQLPHPPTASGLSPRPWVGGGDHGCAHPAGRAGVVSAITPEQQPEWEHMKKLAQEERQRVALQMSLNQLQLFVQRENDMEIANKHSYP